eukprot:TRINITY_DN5909_c0_g1_i1.p1 TRINITY_DN5909_c0_g1~~TRINITY_DN5909_c0_g1_i1.p1  ORF type:complete len:467 (+),score=104.79 TRINITY_DN5909_c0_g1_i1:124-1524(+)
MAEIFWALTNMMNVLGLVAAPIQAAASSSSSSSDVGSPIRKALDFISSSVPSPILGSWRYLSSNIGKGAEEVMRWSIVSFTNEIARATMSVFIDFIKHLCTVSVEISSSDESYKWLMEWLITQDAVKNSKSLNVRTLNASRHPQVTFVPGRGSTLLTFRGSLVWVTRSSAYFSSLNIKSNDWIRLVFLGRTNKKAKEMIDHAMSFSQSLHSGKILVYMADLSNPEFWRSFGDPRPKRKKESLVLHGDMLSDVLSDCERFLRNEKWYQKRGIPYRRGYLLYGPPGNGKSSLVDVVAGYFSLNICVLNLTIKNVDDQTLALIISSAPENSILLLEDVDTIFQNRDDKKEGRNNLTFSGLLNALDGLVAQKGRLLFITTNFIEKLDLALIREGRVDRKILIDNATKLQARQLFSQFYEIPIDDSLCDQFYSAIPDKKFSMAQIQGHCLRELNAAEAVSNVNNLFDQIKS